MVAVLSPVVAQARDAGESDSATLRTVLADDADTADRFDLAEVQGRERPVSGEAASPSDPVIPRGADLRDFAWDPPAVEVQVGDGGPTLVAGAMGSRRKGAPKIAHVMVAWNF